MKKNAFTLVELLAVIVILAVLLVIAVPQIQSVIKDAKIGSIESTTKLIAEGAETEYGIRDAEGTLNLINNPIKCEDIVNLDDTYDKCQIKFDKEGNATVLLNANEKSKFGKVGCVGTKSKVECDNGAMTLSKKCTTTDTLTNGLKFVDGQYTYTYNGSTGWSVVLTDKESTDPVTTELCGMINDKPIVNMYEMFKSSKAESIDLSSFDTSRVTDMRSMFEGSKVMSLDLSNFDTSNVTDMNKMFQDCENLTSLDLSNFNTSKVTNMGFMFFNDNKIENLNLSNFNTSNVTNMTYMFDGLHLITKLDLRNFNTSKVTSMSFMFYDCPKLADLNVSSFDTSKVTNMGYMFGVTAIVNLDLSNFNTEKVTNMSFMFIANTKLKTLNVNSFNTSNVTNMSYMFNGCSNLELLDLSSFDTSKVTGTDGMFTSMNNLKKAYAKTETDATKFNSSNGKSSTFTFVVKDS